MASVSSGVRHNASQLMSKLLSCRLPVHVREAVHRMLRVDHAGEYGAVRIYEGQLAVLGRTAERETLEEMREHEVEHLRKFDELLPRFRTRPTALLPFWHVGGLALGAVPALFGKSAAYAVTVAVERNITEHYTEQMQALIELMDEERQRRRLRSQMSASSASPVSSPSSASAHEGMKATAAAGGEGGEGSEHIDTGSPVNTMISNATADGNGVDDTDAILEELKQVFEQFRDEEQAHLDTGLHRGAEDTPLYNSITTAVGTTCKYAIWASERL